MNEGTPYRLAATKRALLTERLKRNVPERGKTLSTNSVNKGSALLTLFYIAPHEHSLIPLRHVVNTLGTDCELVGLLSGHLGQRFDPAQTVEDVAEQTLAEIRLRQPKGPYFITGFCSGGLTAYEVADRLRPVASGQILRQG